MKIAWYWHTFKSRLLPVTFHLDNPRQFLWSGLYGVEFGGTFIGIVRSADQHGYHGNPPVSEASRPAQSEAQE